MNPFRSPYTGRCIAAPAALFMLGTVTVAGAQSVSEPAVVTTAERPASVVSRDADGRPGIHATRITQPLRIDGRLDEEVYSQVPPIADFIQQVPRTGQPISEKSEIWVLFDDKNIYISCRFWDTHPERIVGNDMRRNSPNVTSQDRCDFSFDTMRDKRSNYLFTVTPIGGMRQAFGIDATPNFDWNGVWEARATRTDWGRTAEAAVPFKSLRYQAGRNQTWGLLLRRIIRSKNEGAYNVPIPAAWGFAGINHMEAAATDPGARNLDMKPYAISRVRTDKVITPNVINNFEPDGGIDVKYSVTRSLTSSFTYRTDFAEAEADDAQVNLTRFSLFFPEKSQFFLEGQGLFDFGATVGGATSANAAASTAGIAPTIFYTRRIGLNGASVVPVIGGARLAGRAGP